MSDIRIQPQPIAILRVFTVYAVALAIVLALAWLLTGGGGELFEPKSYLHSYMADASGLIVKAAVQLNGIQIGRISAVKLSGLTDPKKVVWVEMRVKSRYLPAIPVDSTISITADNLLGDKYLNITSGTRTEVVRPGAELRSVLPIGDQFNSADLVAAMRDMLNRVDASLRQVEDARTPIGNFVQTEDFYTRLRQQIMSVQQTVEQFSHPKSETGKMLFTDEFYERLRAPILSVDKMLADLQAGDGEYGHVLQSSEQYDKIRRDLGDMRDSLQQVNAGKGSMGEFVQTDKTYREMERLVKTMGEIVDSVSSGDSTIGALLVDSQLYETLTGTMRELQNTVGDFRRNPRKYLRLKVF
jgi:phospholipid/cholesterol/gamma-HCH transport system substrate-binding protein